MRTLSKIIIHCTLTPENQEVSIKEIDTWHKKKGFYGIGYHYVIGLKGEILIGRDLQLPGAHCLGQNAYSIGICYVGGLSKDGKKYKDTRTEAQKETLKKLIEGLMVPYPHLTVHGHNEFEKTPCPCFKVKKEFKAKNIKSVV